MHTSLNHFAKLTQPPLIYRFLQIFTRQVVFYIPARTFNKHFVEIPAYTTETINLIETAVKSAVAQATKSSACKVETEKIL